MSARTLTRRATLRLGALAAASLALTACGGAEESAPASLDTPLKVGVNPVPHGEILTFVDENLAAKAGIDVEIVEFTDYVQPNVALRDKAIDANYFQHIPYLEEQKKAAGYDFAPLKGVHIEPLGLYSRKVKKAAELREGAVVAIPNDPANGGRALRLLAGEGVLTLKDTGDAAPTARDIADNPKRLEIREIEAAQLPRTLEDVDAAVVNGNYAIEADLSPAEDAIALEKAQGNPYANLLVVRAGDEDDPRIVKLEELLHSPEVATFIEDTYDGAVIPAF